MSGCNYEDGDWECRKGGYLWYAGDGEGYDPEDCTYICPNCRTHDFLEAAKEESEGCSFYSNNGSSGTGVDIWEIAERAALKANRAEAVKSLRTIGPVCALEADDSPEKYSVVLCNTQEIEL